MTAGLVPHLARLTSRLDERLTWWLASCTDQIQALVYGNNSLESTLVDIRHLAQDFVSRLVDLIQSAGSRLAGDLVQLDWLHNRLVTSLALICGILLLIALVYFRRTLPAQIQRCKNKLCSIICVFGKANRPRLSAGLSMLALRSLIRIEERLYTTRWIRDPEAYRLGLRGNLHYIRSKISPFIPKFLRSLTGARTPVQPEVTSVSSLSPEIVERIAAVFAADSMDGLHGAWAEIVEQIKKFYETD